MLKIWGRRTSSNVQALMWCVGELGLTYQRVDIGHRFGGLDTPAFLAINPNGTIPVLIDDGAEPLWETGAILRYLANRYGRAPFWPDELEARAQIDKWAEWSKINIAMLFTGPVFWQVVRTAPKDRSASAIAAGLAKLSAYLRIAEAQLSKNEFLAGPDLTLADIQFGHVLYRYFDIAIERPDFPSLARYYADLAKRPAYREHVMIAYDELRIE